MRDAAAGPDRNDLAFWFEKLASTGVEVPRTTIVRVDGPLRGNANEDTPDLTRLVEKITWVSEMYGFPVFLRTGHGSGKHEWKDTCWVTSRDEVRRNVLNLLEWCETVDMIGLPTETWAVRERLPLVTTFRAFGGGMPVNKERRYFIEDGRVVCHHPYWPDEAIWGADCDDWRARVASLSEESPEEVGELTALSERVSRAFDGAWSLDWAATTDGRWVAIDMAVAAESWHWESCPMRERLEGRRAPRRPPPNYDELLVPVKS